MMFQFICFEVLVMLSFMFPRLGSRENGFLDILTCTSKVSNRQISSYH